MKRSMQYLLLTLFTLGLLGLDSCTKDLNRLPYIQVTSATVFSNPQSIKEALAKLYAGLTLSGQDGTNLPDIQASDVGSNTFFRNFWEAEELPTDEAVISWNDADLQQYHLMNWTANMSFLKLMYNRVFFEVAACNEFLREMEKLDLSKFSPQDTANFATYKAEARFLRAFAYWVALDFFGNTPFATENDPVGKFLPPQISRTDLFNYVEKELLDVQNLLPDPGQNEYGRADKGAAWFLLARLYLNAQVYTGQARWTDCITYCNKIIQSGAYHLASNYAQLFELDNRQTGEIIFPLRANGLTSQSYGNTTFLIHAAVGGNMRASDFGINQGWAGLRTTKTLVNLFPNGDSSLDKRAMFYTNGQTLDIADIKDFSNGYTITKFKNVDSHGNPGSDPTGNFADLDFPLFRLADVYLMYAEAVVRGGSGGDINTAVNYINQLRERAYRNTSGDITSSDLTLNFIMDERARELYWEAIRRTDLVRFGKFTSASYLWPWKGGVMNGQGVDDHYNLYPISADDIIANPHLKQNPGY